MDNGETGDGSTGPVRWGKRGTAGATFAGKLAFEEVHKAFPRRRAVSGVSFELAPGEIACLLGPSGCGKTTLLRIAAGIEQPTSGRVLLDGEELSGPNRFVPPERRNIGLMFQDYALFPHLSILDNVAFGLRRMARAEARKIAFHALERVGLAGQAQAYPHHLSGGEQQRVALARAVVPRPQVMLMDEPFSGLDQRLRETVRSETLALLRETRATCMIVTHDPVEAMGLADRILLMRDGRLIQAGRPEELYNRPTDIQSARFFSEANEIPATVKAGVAKTLLGEFKASGMGNGPVTVMIRPQGIGPAQGGKGVEGLVLESQFEGDNARVSILFDGINYPLTALIQARHAPAKGRPAMFRVHREHVLIFQNEAQIAT